MEHRADDWSFVVCTFSTKELAEKAMKHYAKYVEWNYNTKQAGEEPGWQIDFSNLHTIRIKVEQKAKSMKEFKQIISLPDESK